MLSRQETINVAIINPCCGASLSILHTSERAKSASNYVTGGQACVALFFRPGVSILPRGGTSPELPGPSHPVHAPTTPGVMANPLRVPLRWRCPLSVNHYVENKPGADQQIGLITSPGAPGRRLHRRCHRPRRSGAHASHEARPTFNPLKDLPRGGSGRGALRARRPRQGALQELRGRLLRRPMRKPTRIVDAASAAFSPHSRELGLDMTHVPYPVGLRS
jgi:hypothetical protein